MLAEILEHLHNWFVAPGGIRPGTYTIEDGSITLPFLAQDQYFRIVGSVFNDGLYRHPAANLRPETFVGAVWALAIPAGVLAIAEEIEAWQTANGAAAASPYLSESFGGYSYSKGNSQTPGVGSWQAAFRERLNRWRKI